MKRAQISIFVIIGIIIVIIMGFVVFRINQNRLKQLQLSLPEREKIRPVIEYVDDCIKETTENALTKLGDQGVVYPSTYLASKNTKISYFYFQGKNYFPDIKEINKQLSQYVKENIKLCTGDFSATKFAVEDTLKITAESFFKEDYVNLTITYPITVFIEGREILIKEFSANTKTNFIELYDVAEDIVKETIRNPNQINLNYDKDIKLTKIDKSTLVYEIIDNNRYRFAVKYEI